jgi:hypothetical protein
MSAMLRRALILLILLSVNAVAQPTSEPTPMTQAVAAIKLKPKWQGIEIAAEQPKTYRLQLNYKPSSPAIGQAEVSTDLKEVARVVLGELVKQGKHPASDWIYVSVYAYQEPGGGETGKALVRPLGSVRYDYNSDQLQFYPPGGR